MMRIQKISSLQNSTMKVKRCTLSHSSHPSQISLRTCCTSGRLLQNGSNPLPTNFIQPCSKYSDPQPSCPGLWSLVFIHVILIVCPVFRHSFGYDSGRGANLQLLDERTLVFIAGNILVLLDMETKLQRYLRSCSGGGIGCVTVGRPLHCSVQFNTRSWPAL